MEENKRQDEELAALTDALLDGRDTPVSADVESLREVIMTLKQNVRGDQEVPAAFQQRLTQRVSDEYDRVMRTTTRTSSTRSFVRLAGLAAAVMLVFAVVFLLVAPPEGGQGVATAFGDSGAVIVMIGLVAAGLGIAFALLRNRR